MSTRKEILEMLSAGEIDVDRATDLLSALSESTEAPIREAPTPRPIPAAPKDKPGTRWLHIHVSDLESGRSRVRVNVPLGLVRFGLKVGARFTDEMDSGMMDDVMEALQGDAISGTLVEVEDLDDNERVHIYVD
ncbi:MAG: hypothetical protein JW910_22395 [Anaerolineae bacterium]|nr:hypothetical protein [Anaerolineae bacterium]